MWALGKSWETVMPRAPSNPKFTVHCFKNLNLSVRCLWTWATTCLQQPYKCFRDTWVLGQQKWQAEAGDETALLPNGTSFLKRAPSVLIMCPWLHCQGSGGLTTVREESQGTLSMVGGEQACGQRGWSVSGHWAAGFPGLAKEGSSAYTICH